MDALVLARIQFAANITFHILFPTISIGLGWWLLYFRWRWVKTRDEAWLGAYLFWTKIFALTFALGVVSGITMSFQFGTNWPGFMEQVGNIAGPLLGYEVLTAFFMEATFLGVMLFGHNRVSERVHLLSTFLVAFGTSLSAFWILSLNSWMHTPAGHAVIQGEFHVVSWWAVIFNPSFPYRLSHMLIACGLTSSFLLAGVSAFRALRGLATDTTPRVLRASITTAALLIPLQVAVGDMHGLNTLKYQPQKIAAIEGVWDTERRAPLLLFAWPDEVSRSNRLEVGVPALASLILTHDRDGEIRGLNEFKDAHPPVKPLFFGFRVMVGIGLLMWVVSWATWWRLRRSAGALHQWPRWWLHGLSAMTFSGWIATVAGWWVTEIGRQPYMVQGLLKTADLASRSTPSAHIALTLSAYLVVYVMLIAAYVGVIRYLAGKPLEAATAIAPLPARPSTQETLLGDHA